jgi:Cytochrome c
LAASTFAACSGDDDDSTPGGAGKSSAGQAGASAGQVGASAGDTSQAGAAAAGAPSGEVSVARGEYIVSHVAACGDCHTPRDQMGAPAAGMLLAGNAAFADINPADPDKGLLPTPNLTPDKTTGLGNWTDKQIKNAFQNGLDSDDKPLFSFMPYYVFHNMTDADADSIVMYLRSIPAVKNEIPERQDLGFPITQAQPVPADMLPDTTLAPSDANYESAQNGRYLAANIGICMECHTQHDPAGAVPLMLDKLFQGNETFTRDELGLPPVFPETIVSANLTPGKNGLKGWAADDVVNVLKKGIDKDGNALCPPMPFGPNGAFGGLTTKDALDIATYITTLEPANSDVIPLCVAPGAPPPSGGAPAGGAAGAAGMSSASGAGGAGGAP